ncbi:GntR family transcriptional regulator [Corynebacterium glyciniphilum]|uniref:GntR family transcriptional regulator n=1 Tax=Corynebacterium glyciniphilum TaxID=1404244 RepID=UPI003FD0C21A
MARHAVLGDRAYQEIRGAIARGDLRPNKRLVEAALSEELDIGRTPIRTALTMLEVHGLVTKERTGWVVREFSADEIRDVYQVRMALEGFAGRLAANNAPTEELASIKRILTDHGDKLTTLPDDQQVEVNNNFHTAIAKASGNPRLISQIESNQQFHFDLYIARLWNRQDYEEGHDSHFDIAQALTDRDGDGTERLIRDHYSYSLTRLMDGLP